MHGVRILSGGALHFLSLHGLGNLGHAGVHGMQNVRGGGNDGRDAVFGK